MTHSHDANVAGEPFELLEHLGVGGFAHTYRAKVIDQELVEDFGVDEVALKIPLNRAKERILRRELEMNAALHIRLKNLQSFNLVRYLGFAVFRGQIVMAMEYMAEGNLRTLLGHIGRQRPLPVDEALRIAEGVLEGLAIIHHEHVFHRDIKPENILLCDRVPKICDLGIARMLNSNELASTTTGTIYYMSPEILGEEGASFTADIWSLGVVLYEMLTGSLPFGNLATPIGTMTDLIRCGDPRPACDASPNVPKPLSDIVTRALNKRPGDRYGTAEEMAGALRRFRHGSDSRIEQEGAAIRARLESGAPTSVIEQDLKALVVEHRSDPRAYQYLGEFYNRCQRYADAAAAFNEGLKADRNGPLLHWNLALAHQGAGEAELAAAGLEKAIELGLDASLQRHARLLLRVMRGKQEQSKKKPGDDEP
jgi:serine/threonine protein kinase